MVILELIHALRATLLGGLHLLDTNQCQRWLLVIHNNLADRMTLRRRRINQISALSSFEGRIEAYLAFYG